MTGLSGQQQRWVTCHQTLVMAGSIRITSNWPLMTHWPLADHWVMSQTWVRVWLVTLITGCSVRPLLQVFTCLLSPGNGRYKATQMSLTITRWAPGAERERDHSLIPLCLSLAALPFTLYWVSLHPATEGRAGSARCRPGPARAEKPELILFISNDHTPDQIMNLEQIRTLNHKKQHFSHILSKSGVRHLAWCGIISFENFHFTVNYAPLWDAATVRKAA